MLAPSPPCSGASTRPRERRSTSRSPGCVRRAVADGDLAVGDRLPPAAGLADALDVDRNTVPAAYRRLRDVGVLEFRRGRGAHVASAAKPRASVEQAVRDLVELARNQGSHALTWSRSSTSCHDRDDRAAGRVARSGTDADLRQADHELATDAAGVAAFVVLVVLGRPWDGPSPGMIGPLGVSLVLFALCAVMSTGLRVTTGPRGVQVRWGAFGWPRFDYPPEWIAEVDIVTVSPWTTWEYGILWTPRGGWSFVMRSGPALRLTLTNGRHVTFGVVDPQAVLTALGMDRAGVRPRRGGAGRSIGTSPNSTRPRARRSDRASEGASSTSEGRRLVGIPRRSRSQDSYMHRDCMSEGSCERAQCPHRGRDRRPLVGLVPPQHAAGRRRLSREQASPRREIHARLVEVNPTVRRSCVSRVAGASISATMRLRTWSVVGRRSATASARRARWRVNASRRCSVPRVVVAERAGLDDRGVDDHDRVLVAAAEHAYFLRPRRTWWCALTAG